MTTYSTVRSNFSLRPQYSIDLGITTAYVAGGTQVTISNKAVKHTEVNNGPNSTGSPRSYSTPNGRAGSVSGNLAESGSDSSWAFSFTYPGVPQYQDIWGAGGTFTRFYPEGVSIGTISVTASHSLLGSATASKASIKHVYRTTFDPNGGSVGTSSRDDDSGTSFSLPTPSRSGYNFLGWYVGGTNYGTGSYTVNATRTLVANWEISTPKPVFTTGLSNYTLHRVGESWAQWVYTDSATSISLVTAPPGINILNYGSYAYVYGPFGAATSGTYSITVRATNAGGSTDSTDSFTLKQALPVFTDAILSNARLGSSYTTGNTFRATGATSWTVSGVPSGLAYSGTSTDTVTISGTPSVSGTYYIYATPYNSDGDPGTQVAISLYISPRIPVWVDTTLTTSARVGVPYSSTISANYVTSWNDGALPQWDINLSSTTSATSLGIGTVAGTPTNYGTLNFSITPSNTDGESPGATAFSITVLDATLSWSDQILTSSIATQDAAFSDGVAVQSGPVSVTYSTTPGYSLPAGLSINPSTGAITGAPTTPGIYSFRIRATNGSGETLDTATLSLTVEAAGGYVQVKTSGGWQNATVYTKTSGGWVESTVNAKSSGGWGASFTS
jgi:large repetitive protein